MLSDRCLSACLSLTLVYCGQTVGWTKMPLGTDLGLGPGHIVLDGNPAPPPTEKVTAALLNFCRLRTQASLRSYKPRPMSIVAKWLDESGWTMEVGFGPGDIVLDGDPAPPLKGAQQLRTSRPMSIASKRSFITATAKLL